MPTEPIDYVAVIRDIEQKRALMNARFDAAVAAIKQVLALESQPELPGLSSASSQLVLPPAVSSNGGKPYRGITTIVDAAKAHLKAHGRALANPKLARALEYGGFEHKSKNFPNTLNSVLRRRARQVGDVKKTAAGWTVVDRPARHAAEESVEAR